MHLQLVELISLEDLISMTFLLAAFSHLINNLLVLRKCIQLPRSMDNGNWKSVWNYSEIWRMPVLLFLLVHPSDLTIPWCWFYLPTLYWLGNCPCWIREISGSIYLTWIWKKPETSVPTKTWWNIPVPLIYTDPSV